MLLQRAFGLDTVPRASRDRHVSSDRPTVEETAEEERALIEEYNQLDAELYAFALGLFDDAVKASDKRSARRARPLELRALMNGNEQSRKQSRRACGRMSMRSPPATSSPHGSTEGLHGLVQLIDWTATELRPEI